MEMESLSDIRTWGEHRRGWWAERRCKIDNALPPDGLLVVYRRRDAEKVLDEHYPHKGSGISKIWYFNHTRDREVAEIDAEGRICANPQTLQLFWREK